MYWEEEDEEKGRSRRKKGKRKGEMDGSKKSKNQETGQEKDPFEILSPPDTKKGIGAVQILSALKEGSKISMSAHDLQKILKNWGFIQILAKAPNDKVREILLDSCSDAAAETLRVALQHGLSANIKDTNLGQKLKEEITGLERDQLKKVLSMRIKKKTPISKKQRVSMRRHLKQSGTGLISVLVGLVPLLAEAFSSVIKRVKK